MCTLSYSVHGARQTHVVQYKELKGYLQQCRHILCRESLNQLSGNDLTRIPENRRGKEKTTHYIGLVVKLRGLVCEIYLFA